MLLKPPLHGNAAQIIRDIQKLNQAAKQISTDETNVQIEVRRKGEIGDSNVQVWVRISAGLLIDQEKANEFAEEIARL